MTNEIVDSGASDESRLLPKMKAGQLDEKNPVEHFQPDSEPMPAPRKPGEVDWAALSRLDRGMRRVTHDLWAERRRQEQKWGEQNHDFAWYQLILMEELGEANKEALEAEALADKCNKLQLSTGTTEAGEPNEALKEWRRLSELRSGHLKHFRVELVQTLAVLHAIVECGDRNRWFE
jgi:hypothetical protein